MAIIETEPIAVEVWGPNLGPNTEQIHVHKPGCADTTRDRYRHLSEAERGWTIQVASFREIVEAVYPPSDFCYDADTEWELYSGDIKVFPCVDPRIS
jgi:hypothetical protein